MKCDIIFRLNILNPLRYLTYPNFFASWAHKKFQHVLSTDEHQKTAHPDQNGYSCDICGKKYTRSHQLKIHKRSHEGKKPYQCEVCQKKFTDNSRLKAHVKIHTDEYAYKCTVCGKAFKQRRTLRQHALTHSSDRPYKCSVCDKEKKTLLIFLNMKLFFYNTWL